MSKTSKKVEVPHPETGDTILVDPSMVEDVVREGSFARFLIEPELPY